SNGSLFEYYFRRNSDGAADIATPPRNTADEKKTDLGRTVYGGGGIEPDIKIDSLSFFNPDYFSGKQSPLFISVFMFVRELVNGQIAGHPEFKTNGLDFDHKLAPNDFTVSDGVLNSYRQFATKFYKDNPEYGVTSAMIEDNIAWIRARIRYEALTAAY